MLYEKDKSRNIVQKGYSAARRDALADIPDWCDPKGQSSRHGPKNGAGAPGQSPVALFGFDDEYGTTVAICFYVISTVPDLG